MTLKSIVTLGRAGVVFSVLAFVPNNLVHLTPVAFAQDQAGHCVRRWRSSFMTNIGAIRASLTWVLCLAIWPAQWQPPSSDRTATAPQRAALLGNGGGRDDHAETGCAVSDVSNK